MGLRVVKGRGQRLPAKGEARQVPLIVPPVSSPVQSVKGKGKVRKLRGAPKAEAVDFTKVWEINVVVRRPSGDTETHHVGSGTKEAVYLVRNSLMARAAKAVAQ